MKNLRIPALFLMVFIISVAVNAGPSNYINRIRPSLDYIFTEFSKAGIDLKDFRISPIILAEHFEEIPLELTIQMSEQSITQVFKKLDAFSGQNQRLLNQSLYISVSAEQNPEDNSLLFATLAEKLVLFSTGSSPKIDLPNHKLIGNFFKELLQITTFNQLVGQKQKIVTEKPHGIWLTNLRIDNDRRMQITGYALSFEKMTAFATALENDTPATQVFLNSASKNTFNKVPVWRFDINARLQKSNN
jgi:hypothetical protein